MHETKPIYVLQREDEGRYADFLTEDANAPCNWHWVDSIWEARWLPIESLPTLCTTRSGVVRHTIFIPLHEQVLISPPAFPCPPIRIDPTRLYIKLVRVFPGKEVCDVD